MKGSGPNHTRMPEHLAHLFERPGTSLPASHERARAGVSQVVPSDRALDSRRARPFVKEVHFLIAYNLAIRALDPSGRLWRTHLSPRSAATSRNDGRKMPSVATIAPGTRATT